MKNKLLVFLLALTMPMCMLEPLHSKQKFEVCIVSTCDETISNSDKVFVEYSADGLIFYKVNIKTIDGIRHKEIAKDGNGKKIKLDAKSKDYLKSMGETLFVGNDLFKFNTNLAFDRLLISAVIPSDDYNSEYIPTSIYFSKKCSSGIMGGYTDEKTVKNLGLTKGSYVFWDSNYYYEMWKLENYKYKCIRKETINPDLANHKSYMGLFELIQEMNDSTVCYNKKNEGFIWMKLNNKTVCVAGKKLEVGNPLVIKNGSAYLPLSWLCRNLGFSFNKGDTGYSMEFRINFKGMKSKLLFNTQDKTATLDDKEITLNKQPYLVGDEVMFPLKEFSSITKVKSRWRTFDNTVLINRSWHNYER